jgi:hypothetical protein
VSTDPTALWKPPGGGALHLDPGPGLGEQILLELLDLVVEGLHRGEVPVDDDVEQAAQQVADAVDDQVGAAVPAFDQVVHAESVVLADGDQG